MEAERRDFLACIKYLKVNQWNILGALLEFMSEYDSHLSSYGSKANVVLNLEIKL